MAAGGATDHRGRRRGQRGPAASVGIDLASVDDVRSSIERWGDRYCSRVYTAAELAQCGGPPEVRARRLAGRFAAKEAVAKVIGPQAVGPWTSIEVLGDGEGRPQVALSGAAAAAAAARGISAVQVSITHEGHLAAAVALATADPGPRPRR